MGTNLKSFLTALLLLPMISLSQAGDWEMDFDEDWILANAVYPYDAEVEYIMMSTASTVQYWRTGYVPKSNCTMVLDADNTGVADTIWCGFTPPRTYLNAKSDTAYFRYAGYLSSGFSVSTGRHIYDLGQICRIDGVQKTSTANSITASNTKEVYLFDGYGIYGGGPINLKVYSFKIYDSEGNLIVDMIPCRKNGVAEFYDRIKRVLSERIGDGSAFTVGPDK